MKVLFDTNVVLDVVLRRPPFVVSAACLLGHVERRTLIGVLGATALTTVYYLVAKAMNREQATEAVRGLLELFEVAPVDSGILARAIDSPLSDYEDAVLHEAGLAVGAELVVTRDPGGFRGGSLRVVAPEELRALVEAR